MAVKTIIIDMEAYELLAAEKRGKVSFSQVIKRRLKKNSSSANLLRNLHRLTLSQDTLDHADKLIELRTNSISDSPILGEDP